MYVFPVGIVLAGVVGGVAIYNHTPKYEAAALLMIEDANPFVAFSSRGTGGDSRRYVQTQLELLRSPVVLEPVLSRPEIAAMHELLTSRDRVNTLRDRISIRQVGKSELYYIGYTSAIPADAANVVNAVVAEYMNIHSSDEFQRSRRVIDILEEERRRRAVEVERLRNRVVDLAKEVTGKDPFGGHEVTDLSRALNPVGAIFQNLTEVEVEREVLQAELNSLIDATSTVQDDLETSGLLDLEIENHEDVRKQQEEIKAIEAQMERVKLESIQFVKNPEWRTSPTYLALRNDWTQRQKTLAKTKATLRETTVARRKEERTRKHKDQIETITRQIESLDARKKLFSERFAEQVGELQSGGAKSVELEFARAELQREERVFELIASRKLALQTELRAPGRVQLRQKANVPIVPVEPVPFKFLLLACSGAFVAPFGLALLREITVRRVCDVDQLAQESGHRVLGEIAALPVRHVAISPHQLSGRLRRDTYIFAESINSLRTNLALTNVLNQQQVLAVTSASPSEGKTSIAISLAMSISNATEQRTLIIDGDMRSPAVASMLKTQKQPGLFDVLTKQCKPEQAIHRVGESSLYVIPAGRATKSTHSVVSLAELADLLNELKTQFSTVLIDTPPILGASESLVIAKAADSVLFCSLCDVTKAKKVRLAIDRLEHADVNIAGVVLSGTPARRYEYTYGYYAHRIEPNE